MGGPELLLMLMVVAVTIIICWSLLEGTEGGSGDDEDVY